MTRQETWLNITIERLGDLSESSYANYRTDNLTAFAGVDFDYTTGLLVFAPGQESQSFSVSILDHDFFGYRAFYLRLYNVQGAVLPTSLRGALVEMTGTADMPYDTTDGVFSQGDVNLLAIRDVLLAENRIKYVIEPGLEALAGPAPAPSQTAAPAQAQAAAAAQAQAAAPAQTGGLYISGLKMKEGNVGYNDTYQWLLNNGQFKDGTAATERKYYKVNSNSRPRDQGSP